MYMEDVVNHIGPVGKSVKRWDEVIHQVDGTCESRPLSVMGRRRKGRGRREGRAKHSSISVFHMQSLEEIIHPMGEKGQEAQQ